jgi:hypothetical protein
MPKTTTLVYPTYLRGAVNRATHQGCHIIKGVAAKSDHVKPAAII